MLNRVFLRLLILGSIAVYVMSLIVLFNILSLAEYLVNLYFSLNYSLELQTTCLIITGFFLIFPDILAVIFYFRSKAKNPEMNHRLSALYRFIIDALIIVVILYFLQKILLYNSVLDESQRSEIQTAINAMDLRTQQHYNLEWQNFCDRYKGADVHVDFSVNSGIAGMKTDILLAFLDLKDRPFLLNSFFYFIASFTPFCLSYCLWLDRLSAFSEKTIIKKYSQFNSL